MRKKRVEYGVSAEDFVRIWQESESLDEVSRKTGMPKGACSARAHKYRVTQELPLKDFDRGRRKGLDIDGLRALIAKIDRQKAGV